MGWRMVGEFKREDREPRRSSGKGRNENKSRGGKEAQGQGSRRQDICSAPIRNGLLWSNDLLITILTFMNLRFYKDLRSQTKGMTFYLKIETPLWKINRSAFQTKMLTVQYVQW